MNLLPVFSCLCFLLFCVHGQDSYLQCIAQRKCGFQSVCSFDYPAYNFSGHIFRVNNGLATSIALSWSIANSSSGSTTEDIVVQASSQTYINTYQVSPPFYSIIVSTTNGGQVVETHLADNLVQCSRFDACQQLLWACFGSTQNAHCADYGRACRDLLALPVLSGETAAKLRCIPQCLATYYDSEFPTAMQLDSDTIVTALHECVQGHSALSTLTSRWLLLAVLFMLIGIVTTLFGTAVFIFWLLQRRGYGRAAWNRFRMCLLCQSVGRV